MQFLFYEVKCKATSTPHFPKAQLHPGTTAKEGAPAIYAHIAIASVPHIIRSNPINAFLPSFSLNTK